MRIPVYVIVAFFLMIACGLGIAGAQYETDSLGGYTPITQDKEDEVFELNQQGVLYYNDGDYMSALELFKEAYDLNPNDSTVKENLFALYTHFAVERLNEREFEEAIRYFEAANNITPHQDIRKNIAYAYFNIAQELYAETRDLDETIYNIEKGLEYDADNVNIKSQAAALLYNRAMELYGQHENVKAAEYLERSLEYNPKQAYALEVLGDIAYYDQELDKAKEYWDKAGAFDHSERLVKKILKLEGEIHVDTSLEDYPSQYFIIKYEKSNEFYSGYKIRQILRTAYRKIGNNFNYYPKRKIVVLLYGPEDLDVILSKHHWAGAVYDGKIRLPQEDVNVTDQNLRALVWHEYTHAIVHDLSGGKAPAWINEGLAQYQENKVQKIDTTMVKELLAQGVTFDYRHEMYKPFKTGTYEDARLFYLLSFTLTKWLVERYRMYKIKEILGHVKDGDSIEVAIKKSIFLSVEKINRGWNDILRKYYK